MLVLVHKEIWGYDEVSSNILQIYDPAIFYSHQAYCWSLYTTRKQIKYQKLVLYTHVVKEMRTHDGISSNILQIKDDKSRSTDASTNLINTEKILDHDRVF